MTSKRPPGALHAVAAQPPRPALRGLSLAELSREVLARLEDGDVYDTDRDLAFAARLQDHLESCLDVHLNRFSAKRLRDLAGPMLARVPPRELRGRTFVELGSGSLNPLALAFLCLALGARRAYSIDLEPVQDEMRAIRALASIAAWLILDPARVVGEHAPEPAAVLANLQGFDLAALAAGERRGLAPDRLSHRLESVDALSLGDGEAHLVCSVSLLEHVEDLEGTMASLRRITAPGGVGHHVVDFADHRTYGDNVQSPFAFLAIDEGHGLVHGCNRVRCSELTRSFERHGFEVETVDAYQTAPLTAKEQATFVEPYRSMPREEVEILCARIVVRRLR